MTVDVPRTVWSHEFRNIVSDCIANSIEMHRNSREGRDDGYIRPAGHATDQEVDDFILSNPMYDNETAIQLTDPALTGFARATVREEQMVEFREQTEQWASTNEWLAADLIYYHADYIMEPSTSETKLWLPPQEQQPDWTNRSPSVLLLAAELLSKGRTLSELSWRQFEEVVGSLVEREGWLVELTRGSKDGGIDLIASKEIASIGKVRSIWQAKKYGVGNKVGLAEVRELSGIVDRTRVTKGILVTTSHLTRGALEWVRQDLYRLSFKDKDQMEDWIRRYI